MKMMNFLLCLVSLLFLPRDVAAAADTATPRNTDFIPCSDPCNGGDVNYELVASVRTMKLMNYNYRGRTFSTEGSDSTMGPTMRVSPGQSLWVKLRNNMTSSSGLSSQPPTVEDYWNMLQQPGEKIKYQRYRKRVANATQLKVDTPNMPHDFDSTNLHLHGLDIEVHMFDPVDTSDPAAPHISVGPGECYCYRFNIPEDHATGMYWYHPHLHGSSAIQIWSGMMGLLYVEGPLEQELIDQGVTQHEEFVIWDPAFKQVAAAEHDIEVDEFLLGQTTLSKIHPFLVNGEMTPNFEVQKPGDILHLSVLCSTIENENTFIVYPEGMENEHWNDAAIPFWIIASDGVTYPKPIQRNIIVLAGGQREEILIKLDQPGRYVISQQGIEGMQFFDMRGHPHNQILATITVLDGDDVTTTANKPIAISDMEFTPGFEESDTIEAEEIDGSETIVFSMGADLDRVPFPQYYVNGYAFDPERISFRAHPGETREYILINANHNAHPFHMHVNRFQVQEMGSELSTTTYPVLESVMDFRSRSIWRDTVMVPPNGKTRVWVRFGNYTGKTVIHCHFLAHEDTGMMATLFIGDEDPTVFSSLFHWFQDYLHKTTGDDGGGFVATVIVGLLVSLIALLFLLLCGSRRNSDTRYYTAVAMNELKQKTID